MTFASGALWVKSSLHGCLSSCFKLTESSGVIGLWPLTCSVELLVSLNGMVARILQQEIGYSFHSSACAIFAV